MLTKGINHDTLNIEMDHIGACCQACEKNYHLQENVLFARAVSAFF
jgi:hypothetical protein